MAPGYRATTQTRRGNRGGYPEHDDFEGLPVRQWREEWVHIAPLTAPETMHMNDRWAVELPHGMPKDYQLLPLHSQELLRAARSGQMNKRPAPAEEDEPDVEAAEKAAKKQATALNGIKLKRWRQVSRNAEGPTISYLAKRHKNTTTLTSKAALSQAAGPTVTRATIRRIDAAGNPYEQTVTLADGQHVDGEIISTSVVPAPTAADGNGLLQQQTPTRRRPPPPKRKKGPGRGRKKGKLPLPDTNNPASNGTGVDGAARTEPRAVGAEGVKTEAEADEQVNNDSEAADNSGLPSDEEGDEEGEEGDEGEDGQEDDGDEQGDDDRGTHTPDEDITMEREQSGEQAVEADESREVDMTDHSTLPQETPMNLLDGELGEARPDDEVGFSARRNFQPANPLNLAPPHPALHLLASPRHEGSPLKNVVLLSPTEPSPNMSPIAGAFNAAPQATGESNLEGSPEYGPSGEVSMTEAFVEEVSQPGELGDGPAGEAGDADFGGVPGMDMPSPGGELEGHEADNTESFDLPTAEELQESLAGPGSVEQQPEPTPATSEAPRAHFSLPNLRDLPEVDDSIALEEAHELFEEGSEVPERTAEQPPAADEDDGLDLLGGLERELDRQAEFSMDPTPPEKEAGDAVVEEPAAENAAKLDA